MRLIILAELTDLWDETVRKLLEIGSSYATEAGPSRADQYLFFQTLAALWHPQNRDDLPDRLWQYMEKASRESKRQTSWTNPSESYERALEQFVRDFLADERLDDALSEMAPQIARFGFFNSLTQVVLKMLTPGVPDIYQGAELLDLSLVDPDNRRPVDFERRYRLLDELQPMLDDPDLEQIESLIAAGDPRAKLYFVAALLRLRRNELDLMKGDYRPLEVEGSDHWLAFVRESGGRFLIAAIPRFPSTWPENRNALVPLPPEAAGKEWREVLSGRRMRLKNHLNTAELPLPWGVVVSA